jgi:hypothetical protein
VSEIPATAAAFSEAVTAALSCGDAQAISEDALRQVLTAAVKAYAAKVEVAADEFPPLERDAVTATEVAVAACAMIRVAELNLFDIAMWFGRPVSRASGRADNA